MIGETTNTETFFALIIWGAGAYLIYLGWQFHFSADWLDLLWGITLYIVAFFYFFTLPKCYGMARWLIKKLRRS